MRRVVLALLAALALLLVATPAPATAAIASTAPTAIGPDCKGDPPLPANPNGHIGVRPAIVSSADPFATPGVSIQSVYGTSYKWWNYDNGCSPQDGIMPSLGANLGNLLGLELPGLLPSWGQGLFTLVVDPSGWIGSLDGTVASVTASTAAGTWFPWLSVAMTLVAIVTLVRARRGHLSGSINAVAWALLVLVLTSWAVRYPVESVKLLDEGVQTAVVAVADGFDRADFVGPVAAGSVEDKATTAKRTLDRQWDTLTRETVFRSWADGVFGDADGATARRYGPTVFRATHFSWEEYDTYAKDPAGAGAQIVAAKAQEFRQVADRIQQEDPVAYDFFTGNRWGDRITTGLLSFASVLMVALFLVAAGLFVVGAYVLVRLLLPFAPVAGVVFLVDATRDAALGLFKRVVKPLVMGPVFFLAALVVLRFNVAILRADTADWLKLVLVLLVAVIVWKMLRPSSLVPRLRVPGARLVSGYVATRLGTERGQRDAADDAFADGGARPTASFPVTGVTDPQRYQPVHHPPALPPAARPLFVSGPAPGDGLTQVVTSGQVSVIGSGSATGGLDGRSVGVGGSRLAIGAVARASGGADAGTFAPRERTPMTASSTLASGRAMREVSSSPSGHVDAVLTGALAGVVSAPRTYAGQGASQPGSPPGGHESLSSGALRFSRSPAASASGPRQAVEGRVLDAGPEPVVRVDDTNLVYDDAGRRVFVVFTPAGRVPVGGSGGAS